MKLTALFLTFSVICTAAAATVELAPVQDAYICDCLPDVTNPNGNANYLYHGQFGSCYDRTLIQWDLSGIPSSVTIVSAEMKLYCEAFYGSESGYPEYFMINEEWNEQTVTYNTQPGYSTEISFTGYWPAANEWYTVDVLEFVQCWLDESHPNQGIYCFCNETTSTCVPGFWSSNYTQEELHPKLVITYWENQLEPETWGSIKSFITWLGAIINGDRG